MNSKQQLRIVWAAGWWLALIAVAAAVSAYFASSSRTKTYEASALTQILPRSQATGVTLGTDQLLQVSNFYAEVARTQKVIDGVKRRGQFSQSIGLEVFAEPDLLVLRFLGRARSPRVAADAANAYARAFEDQVATEQDAERRKTLAGPEQRAAAIRAQLRSARDGSAGALALQSELQALQARITEETITAPDRVRLLQAALPPKAASSPDPVRDAILAFLVAFVVGATAVVVRHAVTDRFGSVEEASLELGLPVLAELPRARSNAGDALEAFRKLRAQVEFSLASTGEDPVRAGTASKRMRPVRDRPNVVLVTSPESGAGKSYVSANLARTLAADGRRVVVVDGDLRRPTLHDQLDVEREPGLAERLRSGRAGGWHRELQEAPLPPTVHQRGGALDVFVAGALTSDTAERLSSDSMEQIIEGLHEAYDFVVLDSPPVLAIVDAVVLSRYVDAVVLVVDANRSRRRDVRRALQTLRAVEAPMLGLVFNRSKLSSASYGYYGRPAAEIREAELSG